MMLKRPKPRSLMMAFSFLALLILVLSACGAPAQGTPPPSGGTPVKGGTWTDDLFEEPDSLITNASSETFSDMVDQSIYAPLFVGDSTGNITPGVATVVPTAANGGISADLKTWTFHMRPGLKWSDGQPYDARDVDFTWKLWTNPKFPAAGTIGLNLITSADVSSDNLSITFHLKQAFSPFLAVWTDGLEAPLPAHHYSSIAPDKILTSPDNLNPSVTSGPFMMKESKPGDHYTVVRNPMYYHFHNAILGKHPEVRQAMAMAIDHQALIDTARRGQAVPLCTDHGQSYKPGYQADAPCTKFDPAAANALLDQNGWKAGTDGVRTKGNMRLEFNYSTTANNLWRADDELILQSNFKAIGIKIDIQNYPASTYFGPFLNGGNASPATGAVAGRDDLFEFENSWSYDADDSSLFSCSQFPPNGSNFDFYCNPALDKLFVQEQATADPTARQQVFNQIHQIYLMEFPLITLYSPTDIAMHKNSVHNYNPAP